MAQQQALSLSELMPSSWLYRMRRVVRFIPRSPRCKLCNVPFAGPGRVFRLAGFGQSRKNPNMCTACFERAPVGGEEIEVGVLFADVRTAARLQAQADPGQLIVSERVYALVGDRFPGADLVELNLKGKSEPVAAHVIEITAREAATARG